MDDLEKGLEAYNNKKYTIAFNLLLPLAQKGYVQAQFLLAGMYHKGKGVKKDHKEMIKWYTASAEQGIARAQAILGLFYQVPELTNQAVSGIDKKDNIISFMWYSLSALNGNEIAEILRDSLLERITEQELKEAEEKIKEWMKEHPRGCRS